MQCFDFDEVDDIPTDGEKWCILSRVLTANDIANLKRRNESNYT